MISTASFILPLLHLSIEWAVERITTAATMYATYWTHTQIVFEPWAQFCSNKFNLAVFSHNHQSAKFDSPPIFLAIQHMRHVWWFTRCMSFTLIMTMRFFPVQFLARALAAGFGFGLRLRPVGLLTKVPLLAFSSLLRKNEDVWVVTWA